MLRIRLAAVLIVAMAGSASAKQRQANRRASFVELDGLNHMFQAARTGALSEYAEIDETTNPAALSTITTWITSLK